MLAIVSAASILVVGCSSSDSTNPTTPAADGGADGATSSETTGPDGGNATSEAGSDAATTGPATGMLAGHAFTFAQAIAYPAQTDTGAGYEIFLSSEAIDCDHAVLAGASTIDIDLAGTPPAANTYPAIDPGMSDEGAGQSSLDFNAFDGTCGMLTSGSSTTGTVTITKFDSATVQGSLNVAFQTSDRTQSGSVAGSFTAIVCTKAPTPPCTPH